MKSSCDIVQEFSRLFIKGEGDVVRHLSFLGFSFSHVQTPLDEKPLVIQSLATDLRDGIILGRLFETFDGGSSLIRVGLPSLFPFAPFRCNQTDPRNNNNIDDEIPHSIQ